MRVTIMLAESVQDAKVRVDIRKTRRTNNRHLHVTFYETRGPWTNTPFNDEPEAASDLQTSLVSFRLSKNFQMSVPSPPTHFALQDDRAVLRSPPLPRTRTVAIVKNHALHHRLDIEPRISEAGFEVREIPPSTPRRHV